jgi:hypothetical protein
MKADQLSNPQLYDQGMMEPGTESEGEVDPENPEIEYVQ